MRALMIGVAAAVIAGAGCSSGNAECEIGSARCGSGGRGAVGGTGGRSGGSGGGSGGSRSDGGVGTGGVGAGGVGTGGSIDGSAGGGGGSGGGTGAGSGGHGTGGGGGAGTGGTGTGGGGGAGTGGGGGSGRGGGGGAGTGGGGGSGTGGGGGAGTGGRGSGGVSGTGGGGGSGGIVDAGSGTCTTAYGSNGTVLFAFDAGRNDGWIGSFDSAGTDPPPSLGATIADGRMCPGALTLEIPFTRYGMNASAQYSYPVAQSWIGGRRLHVWVKLETARFDALNGVQLFVQSNNFAAYSGQLVSASPTFADAFWHEIVLDLAGGSSPVVLSAVNRIGIQVLAKSSGPDGGEPPRAVNMRVDDIWLESDGPTAQR